MCPTAFCFLPVHTALPMHPSPHPPHITRGDSVIAQAKWRSLLESARSGRDLLFSGSLKETGRSKICRVGWPETQGRIDVAAQVQGLSGGRIISSLGVGASVFFSSGF